MNTNECLGENYDCIDMKSYGSCKIAFIFLQFSGSMSLRKMVGMEGGLDDLEFEVKPKTLVFEGTVINQFSIYLEKGVQVIGSFNSGNKHNSKETLFKFKYPEPGVFRLKSLSHATYTWNFYSINSAEPLEEYEDSVTIDLMRTIELYELELRQKEREIQTSIKERNPSRKLVLQVWKKMRREMSNSRTILKCIFPKLHIHLEFQLEIKNSLDLQILREENKPAKEMKKSQSEPEIKTQNDSESTSKSKIADPLIIKDEQIIQLLDEAKINHMKMQKRKSPLHKLLKSDINPPTKQFEDQEIQATVKIMKPTGIELEEDKDENSFEKVIKEKEMNKLSPPTKKFSMLSDIIERSQEGSSSFGGPDRISSSDRYPDRKDNILSEKFDDIEHKNKVSVDSPLLNKFKTLPHDNFENRFLKDHEKVDLRRARTAEKDDNKIEEKEFSSADELEKVEDELQKVEETKVTQATSVANKQQILTSGDPYAKYIIIIALLIMLGFLGQTWYKTKAKMSQKERPLKIKAKGKA